MRKETVGAYRFSARYVPTNSLHRPTPTILQHWHLKKPVSDSMQVITLLDSCITHLPQPVNARYAQYYLERSRRLIQAALRKAVFDYNEYEKIIGPRNLNANF